MHEENGVFYDDIYSWTFLRMTYMFISIH